MSGNPNTNNLVSYSARGFKRGFGLLVRFNNRTGCRQVVCKCTVVKKLPTYIIVGNTKYILEKPDNNSPTTFKKDGIYAKNTLNDPKYKSNWEIQFNGTTIGYDSVKKLNSCFPFQNKTEETSSWNYINNKGKIVKIDNAAV